MALQIEVVMGGAPKEVYTFERFPILVGRSSDCHLVVRHESVSKELFAAWLEREGRYVRVEPRPDLTNPLLYLGYPLKVGISERRIELSAGAVRFRLTPHHKEELHSPPPTPVLRRVFFPAGLVLAALLAIWMLHRPAEATPIDASADNLLLPAALQVPVAPSASGNRAAPEWFIAQADELLRRKNNMARNRMAAWAHLLRAAALLDTQAPDQSQQLSARAESLGVQLNGEYRRCYRSWQSAQKSGSPLERTAAARCLLPWLQAMSWPKTHVFEALAQQRAMPRAKR
ncbi:MAG: hypothetical protein M0R76_07475 [Proteobacteria bacterium]|nr:hypothetical protein [Pseudomonadota bacterium]